MADSIVTALSAVMVDVLAVSKSGRNESQNFNFRGVDAVVNAVGPAFRTHGVIVLPRVLSSAYTTFTTRNGALMHECILEVEFTFVGPDGSTLVCSTMGESADSGDKATSKSHSVAYRTALLQALCIPTDEPDADSVSYERVRTPDSEPVQQITADQYGALLARIKALPADVQDAIRPLVRQGPKLESLTPDQLGEAEAFLEILEMGLADGSPM